MTSSPSSERLRAGAWGGAVLLVLWWTLLPFTRDLSSEALYRAVADVQWVPFVERGRPPLWSDILANVALFVPFGFAGWRCLEGRRGRLARLLAAALALSIAVELVQLALPARRTSATDVAVDGFGALLGAALGRGWELRGREAALEWLRRLRNGEPAHALVALWVACLAVWALLPGPNPPGSSVWVQLQNFSSSFRRFPGLLPWASASAHLFLLGALFAVLAARTGRVGAPLGAVGAALAAGLLGLGLELLQVLSLSRRPDVFQALAFGVGGVPGALLGMAGAGGGLAAAGVALALGFGLAPAGDFPPGETRAALVLGALLVAAGGAAALLREARTAPAQ